MMEVSDTEFFNMLMSDELQDAQTLVKQVEPAVQVTSMHRQLERECSSETQQGESSHMMAEMTDMDVADATIMQSFLDMLMPNADMVMLGHLDPVSMDVGKMMITPEFTHPYVTSPNDG